MKKILIGVVVVLALVLIGGVFYFLTNLNSIVAKVIEDQGSTVTETDVAVSGVDISLRDGRATIAGLSIASPEAFGTRQAFTLDEITVDIDLESLREDPIVIEEIRVQAPVVNAEFMKKGSSNIGELQKNVQQHAGSSSGGGDGGDQKKDDVKRIRIKRFIFEKGHIEVDASALGLEKRSLDLPAIRLDDIGGAQGALPDEIAKAVLSALTRKATDEIARAEIENKARDLVEDEVEEQAKGLLDKIRK
ncbi:MAG: hypothetical protein ABFS42_01900 [Candidatus Krumholzibacteriota bacterium]